VRWSDRIDRSRILSRLPQESPVVAVFELRDIRTPDDELDRLMHLSSRVFWYENDVKSALSQVNRVLDQVPGSWTALILRGRIHAAMGSCQLAIADLDHAATILESGLEAHKARGMNDDRWAHAKQIREEIRRLKCN
jgi:hypothetical protein